MTELPPTPDDRSPSDDEVVSAYLDGEATPEERARVENDPRLQARLAELRAVAAAVGTPHFFPDAPGREQLLATALAAAAPTGATVSSLDDARRRRRSRMVLSAAAAVLAVAIAAPLLLSGGGGNLDQGNQAALELADEVPSSAAAADERGAADEATGAESLGGDGQPYDADGAVTTLAPVVPPDAVPGESLPTTTTPAGTAAPVTVDGSVVVALGPLPLPDGTRLGVDELVGARLGSAPPTTVVLTDPQPVRCRDARAGDVDDAGAVVLAITFDLPDGTLVVVGADGSLRQTDRLPLGCTPLRATP